jgi:hypothetical protein
MPLLRCAAASVRDQPLVDLSESVLVQPNWLIGMSCHQPEPPFRLYRSLRAVKVLLAPLCSTLTVLAPRGAGRYRFTWKILFFYF